MPRIVTSLHDRDTLAETCRELGLSPPRQGSVTLEAGAVAGLVVRLPGVRFPIVCDLLTGLVAYHPLDNGFQPYERVMRFVCRYYAVQARQKPTRREVADRKTRRPRAAC
jgi:hypothetical protein